MYAWMRRPSAWARRRCARDRRGRRRRGQRRVRVRPRRRSSLAIGRRRLPPRPAAAGAVGSRSAPTLCSIEEWQVDPIRCVDQLPDVARPAGPVPQGADARRARLRPRRLVRRPPRRVAHRPASKGHYTDYGYAGYSLHDVRHRLRPDPDASGLQVREHRRQRRIHDRHRRSSARRTHCASGPGTRASCGAGPIRWSRRRRGPSTRAVFTVFGAVTLAIVGLYLLWRSRQARDERGDDHRRLGASSSWSS